MQQDYKTELIRKNLDTPSKELANILKLTQRSIDLTKQKIREYEAEQMLKKGERIVPILCVNTEIFKI